MAHHLPPRKASLDGRRIVTGQRAQDQSPGIEDGRRRKRVLEDRHVRSRLRLAAGTGPVIEPRTVNGGAGEVGSDQMTTRATAPAPQGGLQTDMETCVRLDIVRP